MTRTRVFITVDVECAEERLEGKLVQPAMDFDLRVWGRFDNQQRELGIPLIMDLLAERGLVGTFFVEVLASRHYGIKALREVCSEIRRRGHAVELHLHPVMRNPDWVSQRLERPSDDLGTYTLAEQRRLLEEGVGILEQCGIPRTELTAFRAGNYSISNDTWRAMADIGLRVSSSYNLMYIGRTCRVEWPTPEVALFDSGEGVVELPISVFREAGGGYRHLQIAAVSAAEMERYLWQAHQSGLGEVTLVLHSFELFHVDSVDRRRGRQNRVHVQRLRTLCSFLERHREHFETCVVGSLASQGAAPARPAGTRPLLRGSRLHRLRRLAEQVYKRVEARVPPFIESL